VPTLSDLSIESLPWNERTNSIVTLPGRSNDWLRHLVAVLSVLSGGDTCHLNETVNLEFTPNPVLISQYADKLTPSGLAVRDRKNGLLRASPAAHGWLQQQDPHDLIRLLHRNVRFVGELLALMGNGPITLDLALAYANVAYELGWNTVGPLRERLKWLELLGAARHVHDHQWLLTSAGRNLLPNLKLAPGTGEKASLVPETVNIAAAGPVIATRLAQVRDPQQPGFKRRGTLGYIPMGDGRSPIEVIRHLTVASVPQVTKDDFIDLCAEKFGTSKSSAISALSNLRTAGILQPIDLDVFTATDAAREWLASDDDLNLLRLLHTRLIFVGELLDLVGTHSRAPELHRLGRERHGVRAKESASTAAMLRLMKYVGVIRPTGWAQFARTPIGTLLANELCPGEDNIHTDVPTDEKMPVSPLAIYTDLRRELRAASTDSKDPHRFEAALTSAFQSLGLAADHLGGSGDTDVLVNIGFGAASHGHAVVDAKTSSLGQIQESTISLDAIGDHRKAHKCAYAAVVAPGYGSDRLREWAIERNIALLTVDDLDLVMENHYRTPPPTERTC
jgi:hypothetical protein